MTTPGDEKVRAGSPIRPIILVLGLSIVMVLLRLAGLDANPFWMDEEQSVLEANGLPSSSSICQEPAFTPTHVAALKSWPNLRQAVIERDSGNGILYASVLFVWTEFFGSTEAGVRLLSICFSVLTFWMLMLLGKQLFHAGVGFAAAGIFSLHHLSIIYSREARPYAMATFLVLLSVFLYYRLIKTERDSLRLTLLLGLVMSATMLTHYLTVSIFLVMAVVSLATVRPWSTWRWLLGAALTAILFFSVWMGNGGWEGLGIMAARNSNYELWSAADPENVFYGQVTGYNVLAGIAQMTVQIFGFGFQFAGFRILEILPLLILPAGLLWLGRRSLLQYREVLFQLLCFSFGPVVLALLLALKSHHTVSFQPVYGNFAVPFACLVYAAMLMEALRSHKVVSLVTAALVVVLVGVSGINVLRVSGHAATEQALPWRLSASQWESAFVPGDTLTLRKCDDALLMSLYMRSRTVPLRVVNQ